MIKILDLNDNSNDMEIGTANVDRVYGGRGGKKVAGRIGSDYYLIKMPNNLTNRSERPGENIEIPYNNSPISEYIGSHVYEIVGMQVHDTYLGFRNGKVAVACKDVIDNNKFDIYLNNQQSFFVDDNEKPINMYELMRCGKEVKLSNAIEQIVSKIDIERIKEMINEIPDSIISNIRKIYYITLIEKRYRECLLSIYNSL